MDILEEKYINLILQRCLNFNQSKSLMINCDLKEHLYFANKIKKAANKLGVYDVCIHLNDKNEVHEYLKNTYVDDIKLNPIIDKTDWNEYAKKGGALLFLNSPTPGLMDDIPIQKMKKMKEETEKSIKYYRENSRKYAFPWCIVNMPNEIWAKSVFGDSPDAYKKLYLNIMKICMIDKNDPLKAWEEHIKNNNYYKKRLNDLKIKTMHFSNSLGTDLTVGIPDDAVWLNLDKTDAKGGQMIANMPSYEIFTAPDFRKTNGIVYSSKPLYYNNCCIDDFCITFENGKVISCQAEKGQKVLEQLIYENENTRYLGEVALVPFDSPISNTGLVFNDTLFDENAACHLAVGDCYPKCLKNSQNLSKKELIERGLNVSKNHVDFMIGTSDLNITAETSEGKKLIFKNGNFNI